MSELDEWLHANWDPDISLAEWWNRLGLAGWSAPGLPESAFGRGLARGDVVRVQERIVAHGAVGAPGGLGLLLAAPTIATHGTPEQIDTYVRDIVTGQRAWCQLFSEPGAGSDLAGLTCRAERDGDQWVVNGQKVWTSLGQFADLGMLIARTDPEVPKHQGITYFGIDMNQPGIEIRPLREMTGHAMFNEVFLSDAHVDHAAIIGGLGQGWAVANTTLAFERSGLGAGGGHAGASAVIPGQKAGFLNQRVGDFAPRKGEDSSRATRAAGAAAGRLLFDVAKKNGRANDATVRQGLAKLHTMGEIARMTNLRVKALKAAGRELPGFANMSKLAMSDMLRLGRDLGLELVGAAGMLHAYDDGARAGVVAASGQPALPLITGQALFAQGPAIYGGTDQIQRNILGERVLGLPREPNNDRTTPFSALPKNA